MKPNEFVVKYLEYAQDSEAYTGISSVFTLAQAALESGWGEKAIGNNFFGVKANRTTPMNKKQLIKTKEVLKTNSAYFPEIFSIKQRADGKYDYVVKDWFRKYDTPEECFTDHANFFFENKRYSKALEYRSDPYKFAKEIAKAGYATAPNYAEVLVSVIKTIERNMP